MNSGLYLLLVKLTAPVCLQAGALGRFACAPGWYIYVGSARRNLRQRVSRHLSRPKRVRWHIDSLTRAAAARPLGAVLVPGREWTECALNQAVGHRFGNTAPIPGFGASDCRAGCAAHLWFSRRRVTLSSLVQPHAGGVIFSPRTPAGVRPRETRVRG